MSTYITSFITDLKNAADEPENKGGKIEFLLRTAAHHLAEQEAEIESLESRLRDMTWEIDNLRTLYDNTVQYG